MQSKVFRLFIFVVHIPISLVIMKEGHNCRTEKVWKHIRVRLNETTFSFEYQGIQIPAGRWTQSAGILQWHDFEKAAQERAAELILPHQLSDNFDSIEHIKRTPNEVSFVKIRIAG